MRRSYGTNACPDARQCQIVMIFPLAIGGPLGAGCGIFDSGSIVTASVAPSAMSVRCGGGIVISARPERPICPRDTGAPPSGMIQSSGAIGPRSKPWI